MASNPFGITQVDVPGLIESYTRTKQQGLENLYRQQAYEHQAKLDTRADETYNREDRARQLIASGANPQDVIAADPTTGFAYATHATSIDEAKRKAQGERAHAVGNAAMFVSRLPQDQQPAAWDQAIDQLVGQGYSDLAAYKGKYDPAKLPGLIAASEQASKAYYGESDKDRTYAETVQAHRAEEASRAANLGVAQGHLAIASRADARAANAPAGVYPVQSKSDYDALPHGSHYSAPDGTVRVKP